MKIKLSRYSILYIIISFFVSSLIVFLLYKKIGKNDFILIPILTIIIYFFIEYGLKYYKNETKENFDIDPEWTPQTYFYGKKTKENKILGTSSANLANMNVVPQLAKVDNFENKKIKKITLTLPPGLKKLNPAQKMLDESKKIFNIEEEIRWILQSQIQDNNNLDYAPFEKPVKNFNKPFDFKDKDVKIQVSYED